jgi:peptidoglycan/LPS O-acetylase OafA/YrhL
MNRVGAFLLAPVPAAFAGAAVSWGSGGVSRPDALFLFYMLLLYAAQLLFGLAIGAWLLRTGRASALSFALGGVLMIALPAVPYVIWGVTQHPHQLATAPIILTIWLLMGGITGLTASVLTRPKEATTPPL